MMGPLPGIVRALLGSNNALPNRFGRPIAGRPSDVFANSNRIATPMPSAGGSFTPPADPWAPNQSPGIGEWPFVPPLDTGFGPNPGISPLNPMDPFVPAGMKPPGYARVPTMGSFPTFFGTQVPGNNNVSVFPTSWSMQQTPNGMEWVPRAQAANPTPAMEGPQGIGPQANPADSAAPGSAFWNGLLGITARNI